MHGPVGDSGLLEGSPVRARERGGQFTDADDGRSCNLGNTMHASPEGGIGHEPPGTIGGPCQSDGSAGTGDAVGRDGGIAHGPDVLDIRAAVLVDDDGTGVAFDTRGLPHRGVRSHPDGQDDEVRLDARPVGQYDHVVVTVVLDLIG